MYGLNTALQNELRGQEIKSIIHFYVGRSSDQMANTVHTKIMCNKFIKTFSYNLSIINSPGIKNLKYVKKKMVGKQNLL